MTPSVVMSPESGPEEERKCDQERPFRNSYPEAQSDACHHQIEGDAIEHAVEVWLLQSYPSPAGSSTATIYRKLLTSLRSYLRSQGLDLDSPGNQITQQVQTWAHLRTSSSKRQGNVAPSTYNQRIAAISSFYSWASKHSFYAWSNPAEQLTRTAVRKYAGSLALDVQQVRNQLKEIDRSTPRGQRDYALLQVALNTGRSARELASLAWGNVSFEGENVTLSFEGGRSGKVMYDTLDNRLSQTLLAYLRTIYSEDLTALSSQAPIWISFSDRTSRQAIGQQTIADICATHLGSSRVYRLRHTFALTMDQLGAPIGTIKTRLGHESRATTKAYLAGLREAHNPSAPILANVFGLEAHCANG